jgi:hypothetical protein
MTAPHPSATPVQLGAIETRRFMLREFISEHVGLAAMQGQLAQFYCELGDDAGLAYSMKKLAMYTKVAVQSFNDLTALKEGGE